MDLQRLFRQLRGPFSFLRPEQAELALLAKDYALALPPPQRVFLSREEATPILGFPVLQGDSEQALRAALESYIEVEEELQWARVSRRPTDPKAYQLAWDEYHSLLSRVTENVTASSFGRRYPSIFWLYHSIALSRLLKEIPRRLVRRDAELAREHGDRVKYQVLQRYLDKVLQLSYDGVQKVARQAEEREEELFPQLLQLMRDNVLILTEDHIGPDLSQLSSYFRGYLQREPEGIRRGLEAVGQWLESRLAADSGFAGAVRQVIGGDLPERPQSLLRRCGMLRFFSTWPGFPGGAMRAQDVELWELLLVRLKEFELILGLRRLVIPVREDAVHGLVCRGALWGAGAKDLTLSESTRPLDFLRPWVVDPKVSRFGLIYDITDFSAVLSVLSRSGTAEQDRSYRRIFRFQRRVNRLARDRRLRLEKYLGDGALYSGRHPTRLLAVALGVQRYYKRSLEEGFPFDRGMRIALNYGTYRLLPIEGGDAGGGAMRYEFFGQGIVELTRLSTGKAMREIDETRTLLIGLGYPAHEVDSFFAPVTTQNVDLIDKGEEARQFFAYINRNGALINEGIVASERFVQRLEELETPTPLCRMREGTRRYLICDVEAAGEELQFAIRKLGRASFKGIGKLTVFEIVDPEPWDLSTGEPLVPTALGAALEAEALAESRPM
ncbi:MAG: hypothetical protein ACE5EG_05225 [Thermoanaerobaculia bacterium]